MDENHYYRGVLANLMIVKAGYDRMPQYQKRNPVNRGVIKITAQLIKETEKRLGL